jgi:hypothetical protein
MNFESYTECLFRAFAAHQKPAEVVRRKKEIIDGVSEFHNYVPDSILFVGFSPAILATNCTHVSVTEISDAAKKLLDSRGVKYNYIDKKDFAKYQKSFDVVVVLDEYFTFANTDIEQKNKVTEICNLTREFLITTCKDYKNQDFKDKEFSIPALIRGIQNNQIYLEFHDYDSQDRNKWTTNVFEIDRNTLTSFGPYERRSMFFKQLAKFSSDAGAVGFSINKNLMYKSLIKKNYEHVISIQFDNNGT